jgi:alkylation response protein AidB-like acyl-CoA dehydrogenase
MTNQLNHERVALTSAAPVTHSIKLVTEWAQQTRNPDGGRVIDSEWVQVRLGRAHARADMLKLLNWQLASATKDLSPADASATKIYGSELATEVYRTLMEVVGPNAGGHRRTSVGRLCLQGVSRRLYRSALVMTFGGGDQRDPARHHRLRGGLGLEPALERRREGRH